MNMACLSKELVIAGGGAAGVMAALAAKKQNPACGVLLLEAGPRILKKVLLSGNGRCNLSNESGRLPYHSRLPQAAEQVLRRFPPKATLAFFHQLGLLTAAEADGRLYPYTGQAATVLDVLRSALERAEVEVLCDCPLLSLVPQANGFFLRAGDLQISARRVLLACGGKASSIYKETDPLHLVGELGLSVVPPFPALSPVRVEPSAVRAYKGIRMPCAISLLGDGAPLRREEGELQWTEQALSGICVFQLSRIVHEWLSRKTADGRAVSQLVLSVDCFPRLSLEQVTALLENNPKEHPFLGMLPGRIESGLCKAVPRGGLQALASLSKDWRFVPKSIVPWNSAQVMAGGVSLGELDENLQAKRFPGLYFAGELLDADGDCGGYNLQWAWSSGYLAGSSAAEK